MGESLFDRLAVGQTPPIAAEPVTLVIFGGAGDLAHRKLLPALFNLHVDGLLPPRFAAVGVGRTSLTDESYRQFAKEGVAQFSRRSPDEAAWEAFAGSLFFVSVSIEDQAAFAPVAARLDIIEHERNLSGNRIYYLAVPPSLFVPTVKQLATARAIGPVDATRFSRLIVEKPIGRDLSSAMAITSTASIR